MENKKLAQALKTAEERADQRDREGVEDILLPMLSEPAAAAVYARALLKTGADPETFLRAYQHAADLDEAESQVVLSLYELYGLHGETDVAGGLQRLGQADEGDVSNAFDVIASARPTLSVHAGRDVDQWIATTDRLGQRLPHFAVACLSLINTLAWPVRQLPKLVQRVMHPGLEFGQCCLWGVPLGGPRDLGQATASVIRQHDEFKSMPYSGAWGIADRQKKDLGFVGHDGTKIDALCVRQPFESLDDLPRHLEDWLSELPCEPDALRFSQWQDYGNYRYCRGGAFTDELGLAIDLMAQDPVEDGAVELTRSLYLLDPHSSEEPAGEAREAAASGRPLAQVSLDDEAVDVLKQQREEAIAKRKRVIKNLSSACVRAGFQSAVELLEKIRPEDETQCNRIGDRLIPLVTTDANTLTVPCEDWFVDEDPADSYAGFVEMMAEITGGELDISSLRFELDQDKGRETVRFVLDGTAVELTGMRDSDAISNEFLHGFLAVCNQGSRGRFVCRQNGEMLEVFYLPADLAKVLIEDFYEFFG